MHNPSDVIKSTNSEISKGQDPRTNESKADHERVPTGAAADQPARSVGGNTKPTRSRRKRKPPKRSMQGVVRHWELPSRAGKYVLSPEGVDFDQFGKQGDRVRVLLDLMYSPSVESDDKSLGDWIELHSAKILKPALGKNYTDIIEISIDAELIERNEPYSYAAGDHSRQYRLCLRLQHRNWQRVELTNTRFVNNRRRKISQAIDALPEEYRESALAAMRTEILPIPEDRLRELAVAAREEKGKKIGSVMMTASPSTGSRSMLSATV